MKYVILFIALSSVAHANMLVETTDVKLLKLDQTVAEYEVSVCPEEAPVVPKIHFSEARPGIYFASLKFLVPSEQCYANTFKKLKIDLQELTITEAKKSGIVGIVLMKELPAEIKLIVP